jgi:hypothetical protein
MGAKGDEFLVVTRCVQVGMRAEGLLLGLACAWGRVADGFIPRASITPTMTAVATGGLKAGSRPAATQTVHVELGDRSYPIYIGPGLLKDPQLLGSHVLGKKALVVTNDVSAVAKAAVPRLYVGSILKAALWIGSSRGSGLSTSPRRRRCWVRSRACRSIVWCFLMESSTRIWRR